jgi:hypothetical protein
MVFLFFLKSRRSPHQSLTHTLVASALLKVHSAHNNFIRMSQTDCQYLQGWMPEVINLSADEADVNSCCNTTSGSGNVRRKKIVCDGDGRVTELLVYSWSNVVESIPETISQLDKLQTVWLNNNGLRGEIPSSFGSLSLLKWLNLEDNNLEGTIPNSFLSLPLTNRCDLTGSGDICWPSGSMSSRQRLCSDDVIPGIGLCC